ncbi:hypothetical protein CVT25_002074 [Psilocybe cyanescens]|uniref:DNA sliding clamp PCNA n=1 Tax=Psilocybe cyanescens TaxID=93625 RepID=A0A409XK99_PSICY|nr:hypothetical protein CVT25_002074 [Psilocybe cyanescens]
MLQAMDNSLVALVSVKFGARGFTHHCCDHLMPLGVNLTSLTKVLRCAKDDDICTLKAADEADVLNLVYGAKNSDRIVEYDMKLMDIDADTFTIPETECDARVTLPASEFTRIRAVHERRRGGEWERDIAAERWGACKRLLQTLQKSQNLPQKSFKSKGKAKSSAEDDDDDDSVSADVGIEMGQHVSLAFSLKYLVNFFKSACFSGKVQLLMSNDVPLLVAYDFTEGYIRYYLASHIDDD